MELFVENLPQSSFKDAKNELLDCTRWRGIVTDNEKCIVEIEWPLKWCHGSPPRIEQTVEMMFLPQTLCRLNIQNNQLAGTVNLTVLPEAMVILMLASSRLTGSTVRTDLPITLEVLYLDHNELSGELILTELPPSLQEAKFTGNEFSGSIDVTKLPQSLQCLLCGDCNLSGSVSLTALPPRLGQLSLAYNLFVQETLDVSQLPEALLVVNLSGNEFGRLVDSNGVDYTSIKVAYRSN